MFLRWLLIALIIYMIYRLIAGPRNRKSRKTPLFRFYVGGSRPDQKGWDQSQSATDKRKLKQDFDNIEDAEFEDITEKDSNR